MGDLSKIDVHERLNDVEDSLDVLTLRLHGLKMKQAQEDSGLVSTQLEARGNEDKEYVELTQDIKVVKEKVCTIKIN